MPTFNQLVRKGREVLVKKSTAPALLKSYNSQKKEQDRYSILSRHMPHMGQSSLSRVFPLYPYSPRASLYLPYMVSASYAPVDTWVILPLASRTTVYEMELEG